MRHSLFSVQCGCSNLRILSSDTGGPSSYCASGPRLPLEGVRAWMRSNMLNINNLKTELTIFANPQQAKFLPDLSLTSITLICRYNYINMSTVVGDVGALRACHLERDAHISTVWKSSNFHLYQRAPLHYQWGMQASCARINFGHLAAGLLQMVCWLVLQQKTLINSRNFKIGRPSGCQPSSGKGAGLFMCHLFYSSCIGCPVDGSMDRWIDGSIDRESERASEREGGRRERVTDKERENVWLYYYIYSIM